MGQKPIMCDDGLQFEKCTENITIMQLNAVLKFSNTFRKVVNNFRGVLPFRHNQKFPKKNVITYRRFKKK